MIAVACGVVAATAFLRSEPAEAAGSHGSYCSKYIEGGSHCSSKSLAECNASADGIGAECYAGATPLAVIQEPGVYAFYHPNASLGIEGGRPTEGAMAAVPMRGPHRRVYRYGQR